MSDESPTEVEVVLANDVVTFLDEHVESPRVLNRIEKYLRAFEDVSRNGPGVLADL